MHRQSSRSVQHACTSDTPCLAQSLMFPPAAAWPHLHASPATPLFCPACCCPASDQPAARSWRDQISSVQANGTESNEFRAGYRRTQSSSWCLDTPATSPGQRHIQSRADLPCLRRAQTFRAPTPLWAEVAFPDRPGPISAYLPAQRSGPRTATAQCADEPYYVAETRKNEVGGF